VISSFKFGLHGDAVVDNCPAFAIPPCQQPTPNLTLAVAESVIEYMVREWAFKYVEMHYPDAASREACCAAFITEEKLEWVVYAARFEDTGELDAVCIMPVLPELQPPAIPPGFIAVLRDQMLRPSLQELVPAVDASTEAVAVHIPERVYEACFSAAADVFCARAPVV
jgi:hypothetical protein